MYKKTPWDWQGNKEMLSYRKPYVILCSACLQLRSRLTISQKSTFFSRNSNIIYWVYTKEWCGFKSQQEIYFPPYTGTTYTVSSGNCPSFSCATSSSLLVLTAGPLSQFPRWRRRRKRLSVCSVLRCPGLWLQCSVSFVHGLEKTHGASFPNRARKARCTVTTDLDISKRSTQKAFSAATPSWKLAPRPCSKHEKRTAGSAWETWTVAAADGVRCARVRWEINFLLTFKTASFFCVYPVYL